MEENKTMESEKQDNKGDKDKKIKNLISLVILLAGLFVGSLFADVIQLVRGGGFSLGKMSQNDIFESSGKTWVAYPDPIIKASIISDDTCEACNPDQALLQLKGAFPTLLAQKVDVNSDAGKKLVSDLEIKSLPTFVFSKELSKTEIFQKTASFFESKGGQYVLNSAQVGIPVGKYIEAPSISQNDIKVGSEDSKVKMVIFSDFQCPFCKALHPTVKKALEQYKDQILFVWKQFPLNIHPQAENAALASECANEQGKFMPYADKLFDNQATWGKTTGTQSFKNYAAQLGLKAAQFNQCLDSKKYQDKLNADKAEGEQLGLSGTPGTFINNQFENGAIPFEDLKKVIDQELAK